MSEEIESISKKVITESFWKFISTLIGQVGALIFIILVARILKPEGFGMYNLALAIATIFITFADAGFNRALARYVADSLGKNHKDKARAYLRFLFKAKFLLLLTLALIIIFISYPVSFYILDDPELFIALIIISFYLIAVSLESFFSQLFYVVKKVKYLTIKQLLFQTLRISLILLAFAFLIESNLLILILAIVVLSNFAALFIILLILSKVFPEILKKTKIKLGRAERRKLIKFVSYLSIAGITSPIFGYIDVLMLGFFLPFEFVGFYSAGFGLVMGAAGFMLISTILLPVFTQLKTNQLNSAFNRVFKYISYITLPMVFGAIALSNFFINLFFGSEYLPAVYPFNFLAILIFTTIATNTLVSLFSAREKPQYFVKNLIISVFLNIILNFILIKLFLEISPIWATTGAAIATIISRLFYLIAIGMIAQKKLHIQFKFSPMLKALIASLAMFLSLLVINRGFDDIGLFVGIGEVFLGAVIYFIFLMALKGLKKEDYDLMKSISLKNLFS